MVGSFVLRFVSCVALVCMGGSGGSGKRSAQTSQPTVLHFSTAITEVYGSQYPLTGHLDLEIFPTGPCADTITRPSTSSTFRSPAVATATTFGSTSDRRASISASVRGRKESCTSSRR